VASWSCRSSSSAPASRSSARSARRSLVIACTSAAGFVERLDHVAIDWPWTLAVSALSVLGAIVGGRLAGRIAPATLRRAFGLLVLAMAVLVLIEEFA
jgi:uncharacterized membrane protein YfcA